MTETFDYIVVGGGTAGSVLAARLSEDPDVTVGVIEWGPDDRPEPRAMQMRRAFEMMESEYDFDYRSVPQERGNSRIQQARARILGGCSSHNTMISLRPPDQDFDDWAGAGARGWDAESMRPWFGRLATNIVPVAKEHRNGFLEDVITAASGELGIGVRERWNDTPPGEPYPDGTGFLEIGYYPQTGIRSSASVDYLHPVMAASDQEGRPNLSVLLSTRVLRIEFDGGRRTTGVTVRRDDGSTAVLSARREVILCAGAIDTPRLLLLSGIGPGDDLRQLGIPVTRDLPGVGQNLTDHVEGLVVWESTRPIPPEGATDWDANITVRVDPASPVPEILIHIPLVTYAVHAERLGYTIPAHAITMTPNVARPRSRGTVTLASPDPDLSPLIDYRYFTDPDGYDERTLLHGMRLARRIAAASPMANWVAHEVFPGPEAVRDSDLSALTRAACNTVYHVSCTARMGAVEDPMAVLDPELRVRGVTGLRVADASAFPVLTTVNTVIAVLMLAERAAALIRDSARP
jgi:choline dehydrogenase-like flavoprotein